MGAEAGDTVVFLGVDGGEGEGVGEEVSVAHGRGCMGGGYDRWEFCVVLGDTAGGRAKTSSFRGPGTLKLDAPLCLQ